MFAETGRSDDLEAQSTTGTFDDFSAPPIFSGSGYNEANFFADINHTLVSFITKITPSPDWFVGVDSFQVGTLLTYRHTQGIPRKFLDFFSSSFVFQFQIGGSTYPFSVIALRQ